MRNCVLMWRKQTSVFLVLPFLLLGLANELSAQEIVKGDTVKSITYANWGSDEPAGMIKLSNASEKLWIDKSSYDLAQLKEVRRDEWSVYLLNPQKQNAGVHIDLRNRRVAVNGQIVYKILATSATAVTGKNATAITYGLVGFDGQHGTISQSDGKNWVAKNNKGVETKFEEYLRDEWSVHLRHEHGLKAQIDLFQNQIKFSAQPQNYGFQTTPMRVLTATAAKKEVPKAKPTFTLVIEAIWCQETSEYSNDEFYLSFTNNANNLPLANDLNHEFDDKQGWDPNHKVTFKDAMTVKVMERDDGKIAPGISDPDDELGSFVIQPIVTIPTNVKATGDGSDYTIRYRVDKK